MREGLGWTFHLLAGAFLFVLLLAHVSQLHLISFGGGEHALEWSAVLSRALSKPQVIAYLVFLAAALYHGFFGLRNLLIELPVFRHRVATVTFAVSIVGIVLFVYGLYTTLALYLQGGGA